MNTKILSWNVSGLAFASKRRSFYDSDVEICYILESKLSSCSDSYISRKWNGCEVKWWDFEGRSGGLLEMWGNSEFYVASVKFGEGWMALYGQHVVLSYECALFGVYAPCNIHVCRELWKDLITLKSAFSVPWFLLRDFNERNSGYFNLADSRHFQSFSDLLRVPSHGTQIHLVPW